MKTLFSEFSKEKSQIVNLTKKRFTIKDLKCSDKLRV